MELASLSKQNNSIGFKGGSKGDGVPKIISKINILPDISDMPKVLTKPSKPLTFWGKVLKLLQIEDKKTLTFQKSGKINLKG